MLACKGIFAPWFNIAGAENAQAATAAKACEARLLQIYYTIKNIQRQTTPSVNFFIFYCRNAEFCRICGKKKGISKRDAFKIFFMILNTNFQHRI